MHTDNLGSSPSTEAALNKVRSKTLEQAELDIAAKSDNSKKKMSKSS